MSDPIKHGHVYADLLMEFGRHYLGGCDPCARYALTEFIRTTVVRALENGEIEYPAARHYLLRRFSGIGVRLSRAVGMERTASQAMMVAAISDEVADVLTILQESGRKGFTPVCRDYKASDIDTCPADVAGTSEAERFYV